MWKNIKNFLEKLIGSEAPVTKNKINTKKLEPRIKHLKKQTTEKKVK